MRLFIFATGVFVENIRSGSSGDKAVNGDDGIDRSAVLLCLSGITNGGAFFFLILEEIVCNGSEAISIVTKK